MQKKRHWLCKLVGENIVRLRNSAGMTQEKLYLACGLQQKHLSRIENGKQNANMETLRKITFELNVNPYDLFLEPDGTHTTIDRYIQKHITCYVDELTIYDPILLSGLFDSDALKRLRIDDIELGAE